MSQPTPHYLVHEGQKLPVYVCTDCGMFFSDNHVPVVPYVCDLCKHKKFLREYEFKLLALCFWIDIYNTLSQDKIINVIYYTCNNPAIPPAHTEPYERPSFRVLADWIEQELWIKGHTDTSVVRLTYEPCFVCGEVKNIHYCIPCRTKIHTDQLKKIWNTILRYHKDLSSCWKTPLPYAILSVCEKKIFFFTNPHVPNPSSVDSMRKLLYRIVDVCAYEEGIKAQYSGFV